MALPRLGEAAAADAGRVRSEARGVGQRLPLRVGAVRVRAGGGAGRGVRGGAERGGARRRDGREPLGHVPGGLVLMLMLFSPPARKIPACFIQMSVFIL